MTTQTDILQISRDVAATLDAGDVAKLGTMVTDDIQLRFASQPPVEGKEAFLAAFQQSLDSVVGFTHEVQEAWDVGDAVVLEMIVHYRRHDGSEISLPCCNIFRFAGELISDYRVYMDIAPVYAA
jgi:ketosteroid isomerase-like protein